MTGMLAQMKRAINVGCLYGVALGLFVVMVLS